MKRAVAASCCLLLCGRAWGFSVTMPTDTPVTLDFDDLDRRDRRPDPPAREREPREYREPSASSGDPAEALAALAAILAAPVVIVGGAIYLAGKRFTDWLEETRRAREDARLREEERRRLMEEERRRLEAVTAELDARAEAGRARAYASLEVLLDALASEADAGEFEFPYEGLTLETQRVVKFRSGKNKFARQNEFNADILAAYKELWTDASYRTILRLVDPVHYKGIIAWESSFNPENRKKCGFGAKFCNGGDIAAGQGVGLLSMILINARDPKGAALRVTKTVDERLDSAKSIRGGLRSLRLVETELTKVYAKAKAAPSDEALREFIMVGHNTGWPDMRTALLRAPTELKKPLEDIRLADLLKPRGGKPSLLEEIVNKKGQSDKFKKETSKYLESIEAWIEAAKPKKESKP